MTKLTDLIRPEHGFSLASIEFDAVQVESFIDHETQRGPGLGINPVIPELDAKLVRQIMGDNGYDLPEREEGEDDSDYDARLVEEFEESDAYWEWRDSFWPMMLVAWPVELAYGVGSDRAAALVAELAGCVRLVEIDPDAAFPAEFALVLTGGGMDLSDHLVRAYLACGCVPPLRLLSYQGWQWSKDSVWLPILEEAAMKGQQWAASRAENIQRDWVRFKEEMRAK